MIAQRTITRSSLEFASTTANNNNKLGSSLSLHHQLIGGGLLHLSIIKAELRRDTEYISDMDPYVEIVYKKEVQQTPIKENGGMTPEWNVAMNAIVID